MRLTISFKDLYKEEFEHAENQDNTSRYICNLIRKDIKGKDDIEEKILSLMRKMSSHKNDKPSNSKAERLKSMLGGVAE